MPTEVAASSREVDIRPSEDRRAFDFRGAPFLTNARSVESDGAFFLFRMDLPSGAGVPRHHHPFAEAFYVVEGRPEFSRIRNGVEQWIATSEGETVTIPSGAHHALRNLSPWPARLLVVATSRHRNTSDAAKAARNLDQRSVPASEA